MPNKPKGRGFLNQISGFNCAINSQCFCFSPDGYTTDDLVFVWKDVEEPVRMKAGIQLPEFDITDIVHGVCTKNYSVTGLCAPLSKHINC